MGGVFITGTDTGVGKTWIGAALTYSLTKRQIIVRPRKPVESGCLASGQGLLPADAVVLRTAAGALESLEQVCPYRLQAALSPERAAQLQGVAINLDKLAAACMSGVSKEDFLLVEGAGGFYSPLAADALNADLAIALGLPVLLVAGDRLGVLSHALLTVKAIEQHGLTLAGVVLNRPTPRTEGAMDNAADLARWLKRPVVVVPHWSAGNPPAWRWIAAFLESVADRLLADL